MKGRMYGPLYDASFTVFKSFSLLMPEIRDACKKVGVTIDREELVQIVQIIRSGTDYNNAELGFRIEVDE